jgi:transcriptional regulator with XRE-family HTH domain
LLIGNVKLRLFVSHRRHIFNHVGAWYASAPMVRGRKNPLFIGLALRLKQARRQAGLKRLPLAEKAGLAQATGRDIETGQRLPTVGTVARLAAALGVTASWLAYGLGDMMADRPAGNTDGLGARLQAVRVARSITKAELGRLAGITAPSITQIESGGSSGVHIVEALATALGLSPGWLAFGVGDRELPPSRRGRPPAQTAEPAA